MNNALYWFLVFMMSVIMHWLATWNHNIPSETHRMLPSCLFYNVRNAMSCIIWCAYIVALLMIFTTHWSRHSCPKTGTSFMQRHAKYLWNARGHTLGICCVAGRARCMGIDGCSCHYDNILFLMLIYDLVCALLRCCYGQLELIGGKC